ncbi:MAG: lysine--tRNA ligase [Verrucomicrobia bacterium]|nr:MAG: lysine--tRNA ligase [Verrucomicrobiota bacterium]
MSESSSTVETSDLYAVRMAKLEAMRNQGFDPFRANWEQEHTSEEAVGLYNEETDSSPTVSVAGRILVFRAMGKASFIKIQDRAGQIQLYFKAEEIGDAAYEAFKKLDIGDIIGARGQLFKTKTGEITVKVKEYRLVSKSLRPLPEKWHGLTDDEQRYRERHLDMIINQESRKRFFVRSEVIKEIRNFLWGRDFVEVETPCLQAVPGGAAARPFETHMRALDHNFFLRICHELYLKRMLVGGMDRVFELGRVFRNEGLSRKHNPEFTMLELYQSYTDFRGMMSLVYDMIQHLCKMVIGSTQITQANGQVIELGGKWREVAYKDLIIEATKDPNWFSRTKAEKLAACKQFEIFVDPKHEDFEVTNNVFEKLIEPTLIQPTFVTHIPKDLCPLAKINQEDPSVIDVFELCINGQEIAPAYSEQNDPIVQKQMLEYQAGEDQHAVDYEFIQAMEHGMPPAGGMGIGIDRLIILLTGASNIRDTILYPTLRPQ